jgi:hypothetical protein
MMGRGKRREWLPVKAREQRRRVSRVELEETAGYAF